MRVEPRAETWVPAEKGEEIGDPHWLAIAILRTPMVRQKEHTATMDGLKWRDTTKTRQYGQRMVPLASRASSQHVVVAYTHVASKRK